MQVISNQTSEISPWVTLNSKLVTSVTGGENAIYHSLRQSDYVTVLVVRSDGYLPIVKQYRPAIEQVTLELPGGLLDRVVSPESIAIREVLEETGHAIIGRPYLLGCLYPDTGLLENRYWTYFANATSEIASDWKPEVGVESSLVSKRELREMICDGRFNHALHLGLIGLALTKGFFTW